MARDLTRLSRLLSRALRHESPAAAETIRREGLRPMGRQYVHLSASRDEAVAVGRRKAATPTILRVLAHAAWRGGIGCYAGNQRV